jgi:hypothetical protein
MGIGHGVKQVEVAFDDLQNTMIKGQEEGGNAELAAVAPEPFDDITFPFGSNDP